MNDQNKVTIELAMPTGVRTFKEYQAIALRQAASMLNCNPAEIVLEFPQQVRMSQTLRVTARPMGTVVANEIRRARRWNWLLLGIGALACTAFFAGLQQWRSVSAERQTFETEISGMNAKIAQIKKSAEPMPEKAVTANPLAKAKDMVRLDMNPVFKAIEGIKIPNARLKQLTLEASSRTVQVTYELGQATQVSQMTSALNVGAPDLDWTLKNMTDKQGQWAGRY
jgi:hypothetical protein